MDQGCTAANTNHHPSSSLQHHTALHINPLSSSSKAQRDVGRLWQVSQNEHTCTTKPFSDTIAKQGTEEDVGAKFDIPTPPKKKTIPWRRRWRILPPDFLFLSGWKSLWNRSRTISWTLGDKGNNTEAPQINSFIYQQWSRARLVGSQGQTRRELSPGPELRWAFQPPPARRFSFTTHLLSGSVPSLSSSSAAGFNW